MSIELHEEAGDVEGINYEQKDAPDTLEDTNRTTGRAFYLTEPSIPIWIPLEETFQTITNAAYDGIILEPTRRFHPAEITQLSPEQKEKIFAIREARLGSNMPAALKKFIYGDDDLSISNRWRAIEKSLGRSSLFIGTHPFDSFGFINLWNPAWEIANKYIRNDIPRSVPRLYYLIEESERSLVITTKSLGGFVITRQEELNLFENLLTKYGDRIALIEVNLSLLQTYGAMLGRLPNHLINLIEIVRKSKLTIPVAVDYPFYIHANIFRNMAYVLPALVKQLILKELEKKEEESEK